MTFKIFVNNVFHGWIHAKDAINAIATYKQLFPNLRFEDIGARP